MEKQTVFIKRYPSKGELPKKEGFYLTNKGKLHTDNFKSWFVEYWLEEIELPSEEEFEIEYGHVEQKGMKDIVEKLISRGAWSAFYFILNHLK